MHYNLTKDLEAFLDGELDNVKALLKEISLIPAPSNYEDERVPQITRASTPPLICSSTKAERRSKLTELSAFIGVISAVATPVKILFFIMKDPFKSNYT